MALKDWKKVFESKFTIIFEKGTHQITLGYDVKSNKWFYQNSSDSQHFFKPVTKSLALKLAKNYMRSY